MELFLLFFSLSLFAARVNASEQVWHRVEKDGTTFDIKVDATIPLSTGPLWKDDYEHGNLTSITVFPTPSSSSEMDNLIFMAQTISLLKETSIYYHAILPGHRREIPTSRMDNQGNRYDLYMVPGLEDNPALAAGLGDFEKRKNYYKAYLESVILQPDRYEAMRWSGKSLEILGGYMSVPGDVSSRISEYKEIRDIIEVLRNSKLADTKVMVKLNTVTKGKFWECWNTVNDPGAADLLNQLQTHLDALELGGDVIMIGAEIMQNIMIQTLVTLPEALERKRAIRSFVDATPHIDYAFKQAFLEIETDLDKAKQNHGEAMAYAINKAINENALDTLVDAGKFGLHLVEYYKGQGIATRAANILGFGCMMFSFILDLWADLDTVNSAIISGSADWEMAGYLNYISQNMDTSQTLDYSLAKDIASLYSIKTYSGYLFYKNLEEFLSVSIFDPYSWLKYVASVIAKFSFTYQAEAVQEFHNWAESDLYWGQTEQISNRFISYYSIWYEWLKNLSHLPDFSIMDSDILVSPSSLTAPGTPISIAVTVYNKGLEGSVAEVNVVFDALSVSFVSTASSSAQWINASESKLFNITMDTSGFPLDNYYVTVQAINKGSSPELTEENNRISFGYNIGGAALRFIRNFPPINIVKSTPGQEYYATINLRDYFYDDNPSDVTIEARNYSNTEVTIDPNGTAHIRGGDYWSGTEPVTFVIKDTDGATDSQVAYVTVTMEGSIRHIELMEGCVTPSTGTAGTVFTYKVKYKDITGKFPQKRFVYINGIPHTMKWSGTPIRDWSEFTFTILGNELIGGDNTYQFEFSDGIRIYNEPETGIRSGPNINVNHDIKLQNPTFEPNVPKPGTKVIFQCQVVNIGTMFEENIVVKFFVNGEPNNSYEIEHLWLGEESQTIKFPWHVPISDYTKDYTIEVNAVAVEEEKNVADNYYVWSFSIVPEPGAISGWVFDQWNNPVEGAIVKVIESTVGDYGSTKSDSDGYYYLDGLKPTPKPEDYYTLEASEEGVGSQTKTGVAVHSMQTTAGKNLNIMEVQWTQLTSGDYYEEDAFWSPSGDKLAFTRIVNKGTPSWYYAIVVMNQDGSGLKYMTGPGEGRRPAWSPDGTSILFDDGGNMWLMNADGSGSDAHIIIPGGVHGTWSPDSRKIAFSNYNTPAHGQIYIYDLDTGTITPVTPSGEYRDLAWSPDGQTIAYSGLGVVRVATGETSLIGMNGDHPSWLPDSTGFVFSSAQHDIWLYRISTKEFIQITFAPEWEVDPTIPLNNPSKIAFTSDKGIASIGTFAVFKMPFSVPVLYFTEISADPSIFTPNGDGINDEFNLFYKINKDAYVTLKIYDSQGNYVRTLLSNELQTAGNHSSSWDGKNQKGNRENDEVYFYRLDMHDASGVAIPAYGRVGMLKDIRELASGAEYPRWSPSENEILYLKEEYDPKFGDRVNHIYICEANDFTNKQLVPTPFKVRPPRPDWSRDGSQIVFPSNSTGNQSQIAKINIDGTGYTEITTYTLGSLIHGDYPAWSPTEDKIVFSGVWNEPADNFWYITKINSDGSGLTKVGSYKGISPAAPQVPVWSPDGSKIAYAADRNEDRNFEIYLMNQDGSGEQKITNNPYMDVRPEFTSDGKRLLFGSNRHVGREGSLELWTQPLDGSDKPRCLSKGFGYGMPSLLGDKILVQNSVIELFLSLTKGAIEGKIFDHETLEPIEDANVYVYQGGFLVGTTVTNEQGGYQFYNLEPGQYVLNAEAEGYIQDPNIIVETHPWVVSRDNNIEMKREPSVDISEISEGEKIGSIIAINAEREEGNVVSVKYQYRKQEGEWRDIATTVYRLPATFDTEEPNNLSSGVYQIRAVAQDSVGNIDPSPSTISVEIDHTAPTATIINPTNGSKVRGRVSVSASSSDPDTDSIVFQYRRKGDLSWINIGMVDTKEPWVRWWNTGHLEEGEYELRVLATDNVGNTDNNPNIVTVTSEFGPESILGDFDNDTDVDFSDLHELISRWLGCEPSVDIAPPGGDDRIDFQDFAELAKRWLEGTTP